ncbi:uncharacterized protein LOC122016115 [Zingiber officinale]|uniref:LysM domain-containing protein n=1 Tax=Zingiber officinale TaxID=94328 RepID=A0A8J5KLC9_ZINOF|nr:uncharacterized protein LOC122016115 [Zingiber officinale]KAG6483917.1 hypothetical protein ZIOFF_060703 [Zingiber officinale]
MKAGPPRGSAQPLSNGAFVVVDTVDTIATSSFVSSSPDSSSKVNYIEHCVSRMDTLAGLAIMYGVEISDIKRLNGLMTDIEMFAHKTLQIPLPGRHPPAPCLSNASVANGTTTRVQTPPRHPSNDVLDLFYSIQHKTPSAVSPAMSSLQAYYGLATPPKKSPVVEGRDLAAYRRNCLADDLVLTKPPLSDPIPSRHRKTRSLVNEIPMEVGETTGSKAVIEATENNEIEKSIRRRQKNDSIPSLCSPDLLLEDNSSGFQGRKGKSLAMRPKLGSRTDTDMSHSNAVPDGESSIVNGLISVRKSSSTSDLQNSESSSFVWPTSKWTLKPEVLAWPLFDALPKPTTAKKNKAALD